MSGRTYLGFLPWVVFALVGRTMSEGVAWGGAAALATALVLTMASARTGSVKLLEVSAITLFGAFFVAGALNQHDPHGLLQHYGRAIAAGALGLTALGSLAYTPLTEPYARELVLRKFWGTTRFKRVNFDLTLTWAMLFFAISASYALGASIGTRLGGTIFEWIVPVGLVLIGVRRASVQWTEQFDADAMSLDAMLNQVEFWDPSLASRPGPDIV